ncbi:Ger(x)C family spore germination protein [Heyndrickxia acidicola]|uniref:Ger(X)C family spore germination protein n=1 Tax=Heyndrickxia acidicola TaxID=209389 RepID=A0ABU6MMJ5_9BACI|nr:Ger(x)C family spore germination protein [Heyndrickxia acidicola]MED1205917.1 Ger(x)C family spore germination protein [Heyndrickxia acidicola]
MGKKLLLLCLMGSFLFISGCWSRKELIDLAFVIAVGIDKTDDGQYLASFQLVNPGNVAGSSLQGASQGLPVAVYQTKGRNMVEAARKGADTVSRRLYFAHTNLVVIGEKAARDGINGIMDNLERDKEFRATTAVVIAKNGTAENVLETLTPIDKIPANKIIKTTAFAEQSYGDVFENDVSNIIEDLVSSGIVPLISGFEILGDPKKGMGKENLETTKNAATLRAEGLAIMKGGKLRGWLTGKDARSASLILGKLKGTAYNLDWKGKKGVIAFETFSSKSMIKAKVQNGKPSVTVDAKMEGNIGEANTSIDLNDPFVIRKLNKIASDQVKKELVSSINRVKKEKSDVFGFGETIHREDAVYWNKVKKNWNEQYFPNLDVKVKVHVFIRRTELRNKPFHSDLNKS